MRGALEVTVLRAEPARGPSQEGNRGGLLLVGKHLPARQESSVNHFSETADKNRHVYILVASATGRG